MKKIPTLFKREFSDHRVVKVLPEVTPGLEWVLAGEGTATMKVDGSCAAMLGGKFYKRFDAKPGRGVPEGAIPCDDPDPVTGHWPHWVPVDWSQSADKWFVEALNNSFAVVDFAADATYEAIGPHFQKNPYHLEKDVLVRHGQICLDGQFERSFDGIRRYLESHAVEGIVFWKDGEPKCKIKRTDYGFKWPVKHGEYKE